MNNGQPYRYQNREEIYDSQLSNSFLFLLSFFTRLRKNEYELYNSNRLDNVEYRYPTYYHGE
jgi:hypothetical protein